MGPLEIRPADHVALVDGSPLTLTVRELQLLTALASPRCLSGRPPPKRSISHQR